MVFARYFLFVFCLLCAKGQGSCFRQLVVTFDAIGNQNIITTLFSSLQFSDLAGGVIQFIPNSAAVFLAPSVIQRGALSNHLQRCSEVRSVPSSYFLYWSQRMVALGDLFADVARKHQSELCGWNTYQIFVFHRTGLPLSLTFWK